MPMNTPDNRAPKIGIVMGSKSDWETMRAASETLTEFGVPHERRVASAHRTPEAARQYALEAEGRGLVAIIAGAGGAAHLPGVLAAQTLVPVLGVPVASKLMGGLDSLLSIAQMPSGVPVATFSVGAAGAKNAALFALQLLAIEEPEYREKLRAFRERRAAELTADKLP